MLEQARLRRKLVAHGLASEDEKIRLEPLVGGVSCDIFRIDLASGRVCVKQALPKLRVAAEWRVSPERSHVEACWLRHAERLGIAAPKLLFEDRANHYFVMSYCEAAPTWKSMLSRGETDRSFAAAVGGRLARLHGATRNDEAIRNEFANSDLFEALRIDPFILHCSRAHPSHAARLETIAETTRCAACALIHGDFSPKNILHPSTGPVVLDAECATWGDPAFDIAFCLTHLLLKSRWQSAAFGALLDDARALRDTYFAAAHEDRAGVERRAVDLVAALLLARVDGKSPVEYLDDGNRRIVREAALAWLDARPESFATMFEQWEAMKEA